MTDTHIEVLPRSVSKALRGIVFILSAQINLLLFVKPF